MPSPSDDFEIRLFLIMLETSSAHERVELTKCAIASAAVLKFAIRFGLNSKFAIRIAIQILQYFEVL